MNEILNEEVKGILSELEYSNINYETAVRSIQSLISESYQSGRDAQRDSDFNLCTHIYRHPMDLAKKIKNNTGEL
jgi:hypothetical protein